MSTGCLRINTAMMVSSQFILTYTLVLSLLRVYKLDFIYYTQYSGKIA